MRTAITHTPGHEAHRKNGHVERPERLHAVLDRLRDDDVWTRLHQVEARACDLDVARLVHTPEYLERLVHTVEAGGAQLDADTYATPASLEVALTTLGGQLGVTRAVLKGEVDNGFVATRPPGHHATPDRAMGFCLLSNVAIAARWAQQHYGVERILIVDFDVHHGNGTQDVFFDDPNVLFMSTHQSPLYPGTGMVEEIGSGPGEGATVNVPLPPRTGDRGYFDVFHRVLTPRALHFRPELILVSAGYDAHWLDPISSINLSVTGFAQLVLYIMEWADTCCDGRLVGFLEGGYNTDALAYGVLTTVRLFENPDAEPDDPIGPAPEKDTDVRDYVTDLAAFHKVRSAAS